MKYEVISSFTDVTDNKFVYLVGDEFPRKERKIEDISEDRLKELTTTNNNKKRVLIRKIEMQDEIEKQKVIKKNTENKTTKKMNKKEVG